MDDGEERAGEVPETTETTKKAGKPPKASKAKVLAKAKAKPLAKSKAKAKGKPGRACKAAVPPAADEHPVQAKIREILEECSEAGELNNDGKHHHSPPYLPTDFVQLSIYWTRGAVGVKVRDSVDQAWRQVAYFSRPSPCVLTNAALGHYWVGV